MKANIQNHKIFTGNAGKRTMGVIILALLLGSMLPVLFSAQASPSAEVEAGSRIYLPILIRAALPVHLPTPTRTSTLSATVSPTQTPMPTQTRTATPTATGLPVSNSGAIFPNQTNKTNSASSAVDAAGGLHLGYSAYGYGSGGNSPAYYAYCAAGCADPANWGVAHFSANIQEVQLALTSTGHPRMLLVGDDPSSGKYFYYAACDVSCTTSANWSLTIITQSTYIDFLLWDRPQHYFALDPQDKPRFLYRKSLASGMYYMFCDTNCSSLSNWYEFLLSDDVFHDPVLTFTSTGHPRIAAAIPPNDVTTWIIHYLACDTGCTNPANWTQTPIIEGGGGTSVMRIDSHDNPRLVLNGAPAAGDPRVLYYLWCDADCSDSANWEGYDIGFDPGQVQYPDLALDASDHPRISFRDTLSEGLGYTWCDTGCETYSPDWQVILAEASSDLDDEWPIDPPYNCSDSYWYGGYRSSLSLDASGNPRIAYDAEHLHGGGCTIAEDYRAVRFIFFDQP